MLIDVHYVLDTSVSESRTIRRAPAHAESRSSEAPRVPCGVIAIPEDAALVLIGMQRASGGEPRSDWSGIASATAGSRNNPGAECAAARLLAEWRSTSRPVFHLLQPSVPAASSRHGRGPGVVLDPRMQPHPAEAVYRLRHASAFAETTLARDLAARGIRTIALAGLATDRAVSSTARAASDLGFTTIIVSDATAAFDREAPDGTRFPAELIHQTALASLHGDVAIVLSCDVVLAGVALAAERA